MSAADALLKARALVAKGWAEPRSLDAEGATLQPIVWASSIPEVRRWSVEDALFVSSADAADWFLARAALWEIIAPLYAEAERLGAAFLQTRHTGTGLSALTLLRRSGTPESWLRAPGRTHLDVLRAFDRAIFKAKEEDRAASSSVH
jgi:hypothetical protein